MSTDSGPELDAHGERLSKQTKGSAEPLEGKCGAKIKNAVARFGEMRYCTREAGWGTEHPGFGSCKFHGGSTPNHLRQWKRDVVRTELREIADQLGEPVNLDEPEVEILRLAAKMKTWTLILEQKISELSDLTLTDRQGVEHVRAVTEQLERYYDKFSDILQFLLKQQVRERVVALEENQARMISQALLAIIFSPDLRLDEAQIDLFRTLLAAEFKEVAPFLRPSWAADNIIDVEELEPGEE